ncbi:hypothetical protein FRC03_010192 [Tulasnella sp. 419]|nr:hypothetical protein FRC03_010192 [Tulasnella sp. 419]
MPSLNGRNLPALNTTQLQQQPQPSSSQSQPTRRHHHQLSQPQQPYSASAAYPPASANYYEPNQPRTTRIASSSRVHSIYDVTPNSQIYDESYSPGLPYDYAPTQVPYDEFNNADPRVHRQLQPPQHQRVQTAPDSISVAQSRFMTASIELDRQLTYDQLTQQQQQQSGMEPQAILVSNQRRPSNANPVASTSTSTSVGSAPGTGPGFDPDYVIAMHDFTPGAPNAQCLSFKAGQVIHVLNRDQTGWWDGELGGQRGWFPSNYVTTHSAAFAMGIEAGFNGAEEGEGAAAPRMSMENANGSEPRGVRDSRISTESGKSKSKRSSTRRSRESPSMDMSSGSGSILDRRSSCPPMMIPMVHALALLQNAVRAHRVSHFQPSTACIISCVRSVLATCECLSRESKHLIAYPRLASQRKKVLSELARLVNQARKASESVSAAGVVAASSNRPSSAGFDALVGPERLRELQEMVKLGDSVYNHVKKFLAIAVDCGVELPPDRLFAGAPGMAETGSGSMSGLQGGTESAKTPTLLQTPRAFIEPGDEAAVFRVRSESSATSLDGEDNSIQKRQSGGVDEAEAPDMRSRSSSIASNADNGDANDGYASASADGSPPLSPESQDPLDASSGRKRETTGGTYRPAKSGSSVRRKKSYRDILARNEPSDSEGVYYDDAGDMGRGLRRMRSSRRINSRQSNYRPSYEPYPIPRKPKQSITSLSSMSSYDSGTSQGGDSSASDPDPPYFPTGLCTTPQALATVRLTHDRLLSVIAAFIGHIHSHSRSSHASSKGHLIEMTKKTVDQVRYLLTLVDAVEEHPGVQESKARELIVLRNARVALYHATNQIVEAVKDMMSPPDIPISEEEEKSRSLQAATGTLRAGGECVTAVKMCLSRSIGEEPFVIHIAQVPIIDGPGSTAPATPRESSFAEQVASQAMIVDGAFKRGHSHSFSHPHTQSLATHHVRGHSYSVSIGSTNIIIRPPSEVGSLRTELPPSRRPSLDMERIASSSRGSEQDSASELTDDNEGEITVRFPTVDTDLTLMQDDMDTPPGADDDDCKRLDQAQSIDSAVADLSKQDLSSLSVDTSAVVDLPSSRSSASTNLSKLSLSSSAGGTSPRTSVDVADAPAPQIVLQNEIELPWSARRRSKEELPSIPGAEDTDHENESATDNEDAERVTTALALEEKLIRGDLPSIPTGPEFLDATPQAVSADEQPSSPMQAADYDPRDIATNDDGQLVAASLDVMVVKLTPHNRAPDPTFSAAFFLTFRLFCTPDEFLDALIARYNIQPPANIDADRLADWREKKAFPIRLRVSNVIKTWVEVNWRADTDNVVLPRLEEFASVHLTGATSRRTAGSRILELVKKRRSGDSAIPQNAKTVLDRAKSFDVRREKLPVIPHLEAPAPIVNKSAYRNLSVNAHTAITDLDELEVARQLTLMEFDLYCAITPEELVEFGQRGAKSPENVRAISTLSTAITGWVTECILNEQDQKRRAGLLKYFIKVADYHALNSSCTRLLNNISFDEDLELGIKQV